MSFFNRGIQRFMIATTSSKLNKIWILFRLLIVWNKQILLKTEDNDFYEKQKNHVCERIIFWCFRDWYWWSDAFCVIIYKLSGNLILNHGGTKYGTHVFVNPAEKDWRTHKKATLGTRIYNSGNPGSFWIWKSAGHL